MNVGGLVFAVDEFGGRGFIGGPSFSRIDSLVALAASGTEMSVLSNESVELPAWAVAHDARKPAWLTAPQVAPLAPLLDRSLPTRAARWLCDARTNTKFLRDVRALSPRVLWVEGVKAHRMIEELRPWRVPKRVITIRGSPEQAAGKFAGGNQMDRVLAELQTYDAIVSVSSRVGEMWRAIPQLRDKAIIYLPNCAREEAAAEIMRETKAAVRARLGLPADRLVGLSVGTVQFRKGQDLLAGIMPALRRELPELLMVFIGKVMGDLGGQGIVDLFQNHGLGESAQFLGHKANGMEYIYAADFLVFPSREEAMPLAVLEAMVLGTPVVASDVCGIPELIADGGEGLLFSPDKAGLMTAQIVAMGRDAGVRSRFAATARRKYDDVFARRHHVARHRAAVRELMAA